MTAVAEVTTRPTVIAPPRGAFRTLLRHPVGLTGLIMLGLTFGMAIFAPILAPYDPYETVPVTIEDIYQPPSVEHPLGTDDGGKDVLSQLIYGARVSLLVGFTAAAIAIVIYPILRRSSQRLALGYVVAMTAWGYQSLVPVYILLGAGAALSLFVIAAARAEKGGPPS